MSLTHFQFAKYDSDYQKKLLGFLYHPISRQSVEFAVTVLGDRPATAIYRELVEKFLLARPNRLFDRLNAIDFRRALPGTGAPQNIFRKNRQFFDSCIGARLSYWQDLADDNCLSMGSAGEILKRDFLPTFIGFFGLHEQIFWSLAGINKIECDGCKDRFVTNLENDNANFLRWFSGFLHNQGEMSLQIKIDEFLGVNFFEAEKKSEIILQNLTSDKLDAITKIVLDQCYSINPRFFETAKLNLINIEDTSQFVKWICFLQIWSCIFPNKYFSTESQDVQRLGLSRLEIPKLISVSQSTKGFEKILEHGQNGEIKMLANLYFGLIASATRKFVIKTNAGAELGTWFEHEYLAVYIADEVNSEWYKVHKGFKAKEGEAILGYDIDFVVEDLRRNIFYFIQVKYHEKSHLPYLADEFDTLFMRESGIIKGLRQLSSLRGNFDDKRILENVRNSVGRKIDVDELNNKSHFILVHNINSYDLSEIDGIALYNWNFFRNLLKNGMVHREVSQVETIKGHIEYGEPLPLEDVYTTANLLISSIQKIDTTANYRYSWDLTKKAIVSLASTKDSNICVLFGVS